ncbi:MAG: glycosyl hydrolase [Verrucomicrobiales bacterium]
MIAIDAQLTASDLLPAIDRMWTSSGQKILRLQRRWNPADGTPVFTVAGKYTTRGWTEWTQGFQFGSALLQFDATGDQQFLDLGRAATVKVMAPHVSHIGVHDHGFNNVSTYGNLLRLMNERRVPENGWEREFYVLALKLSGAVQAGRWTQLNEHEGFIHSFNGPQSLFADTIRSLRSLALSWRLGHHFMGEGDREIDLLERLKRHASATAKYNVFFGEGRDAYDRRGRVAHESIFNLNDGSYRCPSTQQGYSPFSTWTRGLSWVLLGAAEQLEFFTTLDSAHDDFVALLEKTARATADFYLENTPTDGVPYWDTGAPGLRDLGDYLNEPAQIDNAFEPVDASAAAIAAQGLLRLGRFNQKYKQAGLTTARTLLSDHYLSTETGHEGLLLHSIYHRPRGWDYVPPGSRIPKGESSMWGDYHLRELALWIQREAQGEAPPSFFKAGEEFHATGPA